MKILELLLSASTFPSRPVLVITYKNHALDQFLEKCLSFSKEGGSIVRVGGRCENPNLQQFNLQNFVLKRDEYNPDRADNSRKLKELQTELEIALCNLNSSQTEFGISTVMAYASDLQLRAFLRGPDVHSTLQADVLLSSLPEGMDIAESLHTSLPEDMSAESAAILKRLKTLLIKEIKRWIPARAVLKSVIECFSHKKPAKKVLIESDSQAMRTFSAQRNPPCEITGEMVDTRQEEEERRRAYETMRQVSTYIYVSVAEIVASILSECVLRELFVDFHWKTQVLETCALDLIEADYVESLVLWSSTCGVNIISLTGN